MGEFAEIWTQIYVWICRGAVVFLCLTGTILSCFSISGTWFVAGAAILAVLALPASFPGLWTILFFIALSAIVEIIEFAAGAIGVRKKGGSRFAGFMAVVGGLLGMGLGTLIPIPLIGSLAGMIIGSFGLVFVTEYLRLKKSGAAAGIAWGAVLARVFMIFLKVGVTLGMTAYLLGGMKGDGCLPEPTARVGQGNLNFSGEN